MPQHDFEIGSVPVGRGQLFLIAGPCVIESEQHARMMADAIQRITGDLGMPYVFKASYDKANRPSVTSFRGPGLVEGTRILKRIAEETHLPVLTDVHEPAHCAVAAEACDVLQIPAFLCRQTDLPPTGKRRASLTGRGASFGYHNLFADMRSLPILRALAPVVFDGTRSVQTP